MGKSWASGVTDVALLITSAPSKPSASGTLGAVSRDVDGSVKEHQNPLVARFALLLKALYISIAQLGSSNSSGFAQETIAKAKMGKRHFLLVHAHDQTSEVHGMDTRTSNSLHRHHVQSL
jgi:hypothetical protein